MITLYNKTETTFSHNGLGVLDENMISPVVHEELNGLFSLAFDYPIHAVHSTELMPEMLVKVPVPELSEQLFRIAERTDENNGLLHIVAYHIFYDLAKNLIEDTFVVNKTGTQALSQILNSTQFTHRFTGTSNITAVNNARIVRLNPAEVLLDADLDNGFQARWSGEIVRDNFAIAMLTKRGSDNGVQIRDKKNLTGYQSDVDYSSVVTRIMPEGYDGLFLPEKYVDSPLINHYVSPKIKVIKYDKVKVGEEEGEFKTKELAYAELRRLANLEYSQNNLDKPIATYEVTFAPLEKTEEYKNFSALETVNLGDVVSVIHETDGFNVSARVVAYQYDPLMQGYISVTLGNTTPKFTDIGKDIKKVETISKQAQDDANYALTSANGKNTNFYGTITPNNPKLGDVWYKENGDKLEMWVYETRDGITQWFPLLTDLTQEEVKQAVAQAEREANEALDNANTAFDKAVNALNQSTRTAAQVETLETKVTQNTDKITITASGLSKLEGRVTTAETSITVQAGQIATKATQTSVDSLTGRVTTAESKITQTADTLLATISETHDAIGTPFKVKSWQQGTLSTTDGSEQAATNYLRSDYIAVNTGDKFIAQLIDGTSLTMYYHYYKTQAPSYIGYVPTATQYVESLAIGSYTSSTIAAYLLSKDIVNLSITASVLTNPYSSSTDYLTIYKIPLAGKVAPSVITWNGRKDTSDSTVWLFTGSSWIKLGDVTATANTVHSWRIPASVQATITENVYIAFFSIKNGSYAGIYNATTTPYTLSPTGTVDYVQISYTSSSASVTVPTNATMMRVRKSQVSMPRRLPQAH
ncbi:phage tail spike protein [Lactococcus kimchii]|uniref:phage tail spike protein n=1 Tax=Lactococcus sp. S-13 TaxID=2507158 RepID=UPI001CC1E1C4|nr:phage tail spike protein [Lactococcus sp. S-13]